MNEKNFDGIDFPAFVSIYGPDEDVCTSYRRVQYHSIFSDGVFYSADSVISHLKTICSTYKGSFNKLKIKVIPLPKEIYEYDHGNGGNGKFNLIYIESRNEEDE